MNKSKTVHTTNTDRYQDGTATHMLSYCAWTGLKIAVSCMFHQYKTIHKQVHASEHPALSASISLDTWYDSWDRLTEYGTHSEKFVAVVAVLKHLKVLQLGTEALTPPSVEKLTDIMMTIEGDIFPHLSYLMAKPMPKAKTNRHLDLKSLVDSLVLALTGKAQPSMKLQWEEDIDRVVARLMAQVTDNKLKPSKMAQWSTEMLKAYTTSTHAQRELIAECITKKYDSITLDEYKWAIEYLRMNLPISVQDVTTSATTRSIQSSTIIQYLNEKLTMLESAVGMFSLVDMDILPSASKAAATTETAPTKVITATVVAFDAVAYAQWPVLQPSGLPYASEMHRKVAFTQYCRAQAAIAQDTKSGE